MLPPPHHKEPTSLPGAAAVATEMALETGLSAGMETATGKAMMVLDQVEVLEKAEFV